MAAEVVAEPSTPLGPRSVRTRKAVLDAAAAIMAEHGLAAATIDAIRDRSGVSKTTIYKHWPSRLCVAVDAFAEQLASEAALPDTGTALGDLTEQLRRVSVFYASPMGTVFAPLVAGALQEPVAAEWLRERLLASRHRGIEQLWNRAASRGEVRDGIDPDVAMDLLFGPVMWRLMRGGQPLTDDEVAQVTRSVLSGLLQPGHGHS